MTTFNCSFRLTIAMSQRQREDLDLDEQYQMEEGSELAFDPDQDANEKREIRRNYRKLQDDGEFTDSLGLEQRNS